MLVSVRNWLKAAVSIIVLATLLGPAANANGLYRLFMPKKKDASTGVPSTYRTPVLSKDFERTSQYLRLDDGTKLAVELYLPKHRSLEDKLPTILEQTRYWRIIQPKFPLDKLYSKPLSIYRHEFITHGYAWVAVDSRGAGASFGSRPWEFSPLEVDDSRQIIDWITKQPWSNGQVGTIGHSFSGNMAEFTLLTRHPAVKAAAVLSSPFDLYSDVLRPGGMPLQPFIKQWIDLTERFDRNKFPANLRVFSWAVRGITPVQEDKKEALLKAALKEHQLNADLRTLDKIDFRDDCIFDGAATALAKRTPAFDRSVRLLHARFAEDELHHDGIEPVSPSAYVREIDKSKVPMYFSAGWLDGGNAGAAVGRYLNYTSPGNKLILGPWDHNFFNISPFTHPGMSKFRIDQEMLKFFDEHMKSPNLVESGEKPVHYFTLGEERWHESDKWPPLSVPTEQYLSENHELSPNCQTTSGSDDYRINFKAGSGKSGRWDCMLGNPLLQPYPKRKQEDKLLLCYDSQPLTEDLRVTGHPSVNLFLKSNGDDCSLFVYLEDVAPDGFVRYVTEGELLCGNRVRCGNGPLKTVVPKPTYCKADYHTLPKDGVTRVEVGMLPMSYQFKKGHKIRLSIAGADKDHFQAPKFASLCTELEVLRGSEYPSRLSLPQDVNGTESLAVTRP